MAADLDGLVARTLDAEPDLLPLIPELLADLNELGTSADEVVTALRSVGLEPGSAVLDLGCGKGAVALALAEHLGARVEGIDAFRPFVEAARAAAAERGVAHACTFREEDLRGYLGRGAAYDAVLLLGVGPVSGTHERTVGDLRGLVRPGGWIVLGDAYLADGAEALPGYEGYAGRAATLRGLVAFGDRLVLETVLSADATRSTNLRNTALIRERARRLRAAHPGLARRIDDYVAKQERETLALGDAVVCATWVLQVGRAPRP